jgi:hypothetical protein
VICPLRNDESLGLLLACLLYGTAKSQRVVALEGIFFNVVGNIYLAAFCLTAAECKAQGGCQYE